MVYSLLFWLLGIRDPVSPRRNYFESWRRVHIRREVMEKIFRRAPPLFWLYKSN